MEILRKKTPEVLKLYQAQCDEMVPHFIDLLKTYFKKANPLMPKESIEICISYIGFFMFNALREKGDENADRGTKPVSDENSEDQGPKGSAKQTVTGIRKGT